MAVHSEVSKAVKQHGALSGATVVDGTSTMTIDLDSKDLDAKTLRELGRVADVNGYELRIAKGTAGTGSPALLTFAPKGS